MRKDIWHYSAGHYRIGGKKIIKPHCLTIFVYDTEIEMKFLNREIDNMFQVARVIDREMKLNYSYYIRGVKE